MQLSSFNYADNARFQHRGHIEVMVLHKPLKTANSLRLLHVYRAGEGQIVGELESFVLGSRHTPAYRAISYVWGDPIHRRKIGINGHSVSILASVYAILEALCDTPEQFFRDHDSTTSAWVWIDSICINQKDVVEVGQQVAYMASIFGDAASAIVWLGSGTAQTDRGMDLMKSLAMCDVKTPIPDLLLDHTESWSGFLEVARNSWWRRSWTLQESLVPQDIVYHYGTRCLSENQVRRAILVTYENVIPRSASLDREPWAAMFNRARITQWYWSNDTPLPGQAIKILALLAYTRHARASNDRDYIYSLVGCINPEDRSIVGQPNYALSVESIYTAFCRKWIVKHQSLDIICFATLFKPRSTGDESDLPSWVPDWRDRPLVTWSASNPVPLLVCEPTNQHVGSFLPKTTPAENECKRSFSATGDKRVYFHFSGDTALLTCRGKTIDILDGLAGMVDSVDQESTRSYEPLIQSTSSLNGSSSCLEAHSTSPPARTAMDIALALVLGRKDVYLKHEAQPDRVLAQILHTCKDRVSSRNIKGRRTREIIAWLELNGPLLVRGNTLSDILDPARHDDLSTPREGDVSLEYGAEHDIRWKFKKVASLRDMARRLAVTNHGYVGMVPQNARKGDLVCILYGCTVPVVLRPNIKDRYKLVGECYLQGFMEGQAVGDEQYDTRQYVIS